MTELIPIINPRELPPVKRKSRSHLPSLADLVSSQRSDDECKAADYLRQGVACGIYFDPGLSRDVLRPEVAIGDELGKGADGAPIVAQASYTDGTWVWWGALIYYLTNYHLRLPAEFLIHARQRRWRIDPGCITVRDLDDSALDATHLGATAHL